MGLDKIKCQQCGRNMLVATDKVGGLRKPPHICGRKSCKKMRDKNV
jgi:hypothetical protein